MTLNLTWITIQSSSSFNVSSPYPHATKSFTTFTLFIPYLLAILLPLTIQLPPLVNVPTSLKHGPATAKQALLYREYWRGTLSKNIEMISSIQENSLLVNFWLDLMMLRFLHGRPISTNDILVYVPPTSAASTVLIEFGFVRRMPVPIDIEVWFSNCSTRKTHVEKKWNCDFIFS